MAAHVYQTDPPSRMHFSSSERQARKTMKSSLGEGFMENQHSHYLLTGRFLSEDEAKTKLNVARVTAIYNLAELRARNFVGVATGIEGGSVRDFEHLGAELEIEAFANHGVLDEGHIEVDSTGTAKAGLAHAIGRNR